MANTGLRLFPHSYPAPRQEVALRNATPIKSPKGEHYSCKDTIDRDGELTLRHAGKLRHLGMRPDYAGIPVRMLVSNRDVVVTNKKTGEILRYFKSIQRGSSKSDSKARAGSESRPLTSLFGEDLRLEQRGTASLCSPRIGIRVARPGTGRWPGEIGVRTGRSTTVADVRMREVAVEALVAGW